MLVEQEPAPTHASERSRCVSRRNATAPQVTIIAEGDLVVSGLPALDEW
ncbi:MAG TPA: hypothetical protein VFG94_05560 [Acidimicrobiales bacterium]|nr:hypothetical protein [Acidimicrobiales bacterium]